MSPPRRACASIAVVVLSGCAQPSPASTGEPSVGHTESRVVKTIGALNTNRESAQCAVLPTGHVLIAGGYWGLPLSSAELLDPSTLTWSNVAAMPEAHYSAAAITLPSGEVLVHGGYDIPGGMAKSTLSSAARFDPGTRTWKAAAPSKGARAGHSLSRLLDGRILAVGGFTLPDYAQPTSTTEIYDPAKDAWTDGPPLSLPRATHVAVTLANGAVFVVGHQNAGYAEYLPAGAPAWIQTGAMIGIHDHPAAAVLPDGRVVVAGGGDGAQQPLSTAEVWEPTKGWSAAPPMPAPRDDISLLPLPSGALLAGGDGAPGALARLDPGLTGWTDAGQLALARQIGACVLPFQGGALFAGGVDYNGTVTYATEVYQGAGAGTACASADECASGGCAGGQCTAPPPIDAGVQDADAGASAVDAAPPAPISAAFQRCAHDAECPSGHCADGVCCDTPCTSLCHSCALPSSIGRCTPEPAGVDLRGECGAAATCIGTCGAGGTCVGAGAGTQCAASKCTSTSSGVGPAVCAAAGARCPTDAVIAFDCAPFVCEPAFGACRSACSSSSDCAGGYVCDVDAKSCVAPAPSTSSGGCAVAPMEPMERVERGAREGAAAAVLAALIALGRLRPRRRGAEPRRGPTTPCS